MHTLRIMRSSLVNGLRSGRTVAILFLVVISVLAAFVGMSLDQAAMERYIKTILPEGQTSSTVPYYLLTPGTAHAQVWNATNYRSIRSTPLPGGGLFPMRYVAVWIAFIGPLIGLILTFDSVSSELESGVIRSLFSVPVDRRAIANGKLAGHVLSAFLTLALGLLASFLLVARFTDVSWNGDQMMRMAVFFGWMGAYVAAFALLGMLLSVTLRRSNRAMQMCLIVVIGLFGFHVIAENVAGMRPWDLPETPRMSQEVREYLHWADVRGSDPSEAPDFVTEFIDDLHVYNVTVYEIASDRYASERWLHFVSPSHGFLHVAAQLLQDQYTHSTDVFRALPTDAFGGRLGSSVRAFGPELIWMLLILVGLFLTLKRAMARLEV